MKGHLRVMRFARLARALRGVRVIRLLRYIGSLRTIVWRGAETRDWPRKVVVYWDVLILTEIEVIYWDFLIFTGIELIELIEP